jgi:16S rRNA (cytosine967-C5)-methyltransferase
LPQEGEHHVHKLLSNFRELRVDKYLPKDLVFLEKYRADEGGLRLLPNHFADSGGTDGFYIAKLVKV